MIRYNIHLLESASQNPWKGSSRGNGQEESQKNIEWFIPWVMEKSSYMFFHYDSIILSNDNQLEQTTWVVFKHRCRWTHGERGIYGELEGRRTMTPKPQGSVELMGNRWFYGWGRSEMRDGFSKTEANSGWRMEICWLYGLKERKWWWCFFSEKHSAIVKIVYICKQTNKWKTIWLQQLRLPKREEEKRNSHLRREERWMPLSFLKTEAWRLSLNIEERLG